MMLSPVLQAFGHKRKFRPFSEFMPFKETLAAAKAAGVSVGEYIERKDLTGSRTARDQTMDGLVSVGVFDGPIERVCEIGRVLAALSLASLVRFLEHLRSLRKLSVLSFFYRGRKFVDSGPRTWIGSVRLQN
jgi:hypothetical protein